MNRFKWFYHPVFIFVFSIVALAASLALYIYWYIEVSAGLKAVIEKYNLDPSQFLEVQTWVVILVLSILVAIILAGVFLIFIYNQKTWQLYRMQRNFINSFTHELKTPVTSLKLYLETFAKHELPREDRLRYVGFMIQDVDRLLDNINRILELARIESGSYLKEFVGRRVPGDAVADTRAGVVPRTFASPSGEPGSSGEAGAVDRKIPAESVQQKSSPPGRPGYGGAGS